MLEKTCRLASGACPLLSDKLDERRLAYRGRQLCVGWMVWPKHEGFALASREKPRKGRMARGLGR